MKLSLRPYQAAAVAAIKRALNAKDNALLVAPCGAGKTVIFCEIVRWLREANRRCLILLDREALVLQAYERLKEYLGENVGVVCAALGRKDLRWDVTVASRQSLAPMMRNGQKGLKFNLTIVDEAHLAHPTRGQYSEILKQLKENYPQARTLGVTATPFRLFGGPIYGRKTSMFSSIDYKISVSELLEQGHLCPLVWKVRKSDFLRQLDLVEKTAAGELDETQQNEVLKQPTFVQGVFDVWSEYARDRKVAVYALNISHAEAIQEVFSVNGIPTWIIHSKLRAHEVRKRISEFTQGNGVIINCSILSIGVDIPSITAIILARRTLSSSLFIQIVGRGARPHPVKENCLVLDLCGSCLIHGIELDNPVTQIAGDEDRPPPIKVCPICEGVCSIQTRVCKCGFKFPVAEIDEFERQGKLRDAGDPGELVDAIPFQTEEAHYIKYVKHRVGHGESVCAFYYGVPPVGKFIGRQHLFTDYRFGKTNVDRSRYYWFNLGGKYPMPKNPSEWIARAEELTGHATVTLDVSGKKGSAIIKKVEGQGRETPAQAV